MDPVEWGGKVAGPPSYDTRGVRNKHEFPLHPNYYVPHGVDYGILGQQMSWSAYDPYAIADLAYFNHVYGTDQDPIYRPDNNRVALDLPKLMDPTTWIGKRVDSLTLPRPFKILGFVNGVPEKVPNDGSSNKFRVTKVWVDKNGIVRAFSS